MSTELPAPPVPANLDLRDFRWMKLDLLALFNSDFNATPDDTAWRAGVTLWGKAWHQVPAGSLPDDDATLCNLAGLGRDLRTWKRIRAAAMHGFEKCADGRLYHRFLCAMATEAAEERRKYEERRARDRDRKRGGNSGGNPPDDAPPSGGNPAERNPVSPEIHMEKAIEGQGQGPDRDKEKRTATPATTSTKVQKSSSGAARRVGKIASLGSVISGETPTKFQSQQARDEFAVTACVPLLPGRDDGERWALALAAEDPSAPNHDKAVALMLAAAKTAGVGWISPERRAGDAR